MLLTGPSAERAPRAPSPRLGAAICPGDPLRAADPVADPRPVQPPLTCCIRVDAGPGGQRTQISAPRLLTDAGIAAGFATAGSAFLRRPRPGGGNNQGAAAAGASGRDPSMTGAA